MKLLFLIMTMTSITSTSISSDDLTKISVLIHEFAKAADTQDAQRMSLVMHPQYRSIVNQAFGSPEIQSMDKSAYLDLMEKGVIGGDERAVTILSIDVEDKNGVVKVRLEGNELIFTTFIQVVKTADGNWQVMSDMPMIEKRN